MNTLTEKSSRAHMRIKLNVYGHTKDSFGNPRLDRSKVTTVTLYTGENLDGTIESIHDRIKRFLTEITGDKFGNPQPSQNPVYEIKEIMQVSAYPSL